MSFLKFRSKSFTYGVSCALVFSCTVLFSSSLFAKERVYILAGQSNMMGKGKTHQLPVFLKRQPSNVEFYYQGRKRQLAKFSHFGPEVSFAHAISRAFPNDKHIIIKHVATGSSINQWLPGSGLFAGLLRQRGFVKVGTQTNNLSNLANTKVDAVIWMQGERDARSESNAYNYESNLKRFITGVRRQLDSPRSVFIMGEVNPEDPAFFMLDTVQQAQVNTQRTLPGVKLVSTNGLGKIYDHVHYDTQGQLELGKRFARAYTNR
ncbi:sialate O-acetylesterase [uncultured Cocleimonas sp.]|uniref:sialate O-acetylesterase n=1 Tax=uncultured Cocleimonas sp. TaxID=1051587 RepID=UPI002606EB75|nr:sialate O-acetylesterase [uncultured Cocleimonas sp.]